MGLLVIFGGLGLFICLMLLIADIVTDREYWDKILYVVLFLALVVIFGAWGEKRAKENLEIKVTEYQAFRIKEKDIESKYPMLIRETHYDYPSYSLFFNDRREYEILDLDK